MKRAGRMDAGAEGCCGKDVREKGHCAREGGRVWVEGKGTCKARVVVVLSLRSTAVSHMKVFQASAATIVHAHR